MLANLAGCRGIVQLRGLLTSDTRASGVRPNNQLLTKRTLANQWFEVNTILGSVPQSAVRRMEVWYTIGPTSDHCFGGTLLASPWEPSWCSLTVDSALRIDLGSPIITDREGLVGLTCPQQSSTAVSPAPFKLYSLVPSVAPFDMRHALTVFGQSHECVVIYDLALVVSPASGRKNEDRTGTLARTK